jgi:hypothetical protein
VACQVLDVLLEVTVDEIGRFELMGSQDHGRPNVNLRRR